MHLPLRSRPAWRLAATLGFVLLLTDCLFVPPEVPLPRFDNEAFAEVRAAGHRVCVVIPFEDERPIPDRIGAAKNAFNVEVTPIPLTEKPAAWLAESLAEALHGSGFEIVPSLESSPEALRLEGKLLQLYVEQHSARHPVVEADIHVRLVATTPSGVRAERDFYAKGMTHPPLEIRWEHFRQSLGQATFDLLFRMSAGVKELYGLLPSESWRGAARGDPGRPDS